MFFFRPLLFAVTALVFDHYSHYTYDDYGMHTFCSLMSLSFLCDILILCMYMYNSIAIYCDVEYYITVYIVSLPLLPFDVSIGGTPYFKD